MGALHHRSDAMMTSGMSCVPCTLRHIVQKDTGANTAPQWDIVDSSINTYHTSCESDRAHVTVARHCKHCQRHPPQEVFQLDL